MTPTTSGENELREPAVKGEGFRRPQGGFEFIHIGAEKIPVSELIATWNRRKDGLGTVSAWVTDGTAPEIPKGVSRSFIVAVKRGGERRDPNKVYTFPAIYANAYALEYPDCICANEDDHDDGCPTTGWFTERTSQEFDGIYEPLLGPQDTVVGWRVIDQFPEPKSCLTSIGVEAGK